VAGGGLVVRFAAQLGWGRPWPEKYSTREERLLETSDNGNDHGVRRARFNQDGIGGVQRTGSHE